MKLSSRLFLAFFLYAFIPVSLMALVTLELAGRDLERATSPGIERALTQARAVVDQTHAELAGRALRTLRGCGPALSPADLLARGLDFVLIADGADTVAAWADPAPPERLLAALARRAAPRDTTGTAVLRERLAVYGLHHRGGSLVVGGYLLPAEQRAGITELAGALQRFGQLKLFASVHRRFLRLLWLGASLAYLLIILAVARITARGLTRPLARLGDLVETVGPGHWDVRLDYARRDEIGALVDGFNRMSVRLDETTRQLIAAEKAAAWQQTARVIAHGIKNILAPVKLAMTRLALAVDEADHERASPLGTIQAELDRLEKTARDFSLYGRPVRVPDAPVDLNAVARQAVQIAAPPCEGVHVTLSPAEAPPSVLADWDMLREALVNLIKNGCEAAGPGGTVDVATLRQGEEGVVTVSDSGPGIDPALGARIFEPYVTTRPGGTGLGLAIVRKIIESCGGRVDFATAPGRTTFMLALPLHGTRADGAERGPGPDAGPQRPVPAPGEERRK